VRGDTADVVAANLTLAGVQPTSTCLDGFRDTRLSDVPRSDGNATSITSE